MPSDSIEMGTKVKGLFRGLRYVSQIFDEQKEKEMQIGLPTDVKHVAHIGWDGPSVDSPSWMKGFDSPGDGHQSSPLNIGEPGDNPEMTWGSGDSKGGLQRASKASARDLADIPKPTRPQSLTDDTETGSPRKEKSRRSRRQHLKDSINNKLNPDGSGGIDSENSDIPKKSRRKKSKESTSSRSSKSSRGRRSSSGSCSSSGLLACSADPESSVTSRISNKEEEKESSEAC